jgi:hypothetical protein
MPKPIIHQPFEMKYKSEIDGFMFQHAGRGFLDSCRFFDSAP